MAFVGREREVALLAAALQRAANGLPSRVALSGPLGIGMTALFDEFCARLTDEPGITVLRARCHPARSGVAYGALAEALAEALAGLPDERLADVAGPVGWDLVALRPEVADRLAAAGAPAAAPPLEAPDQRGARMHESLLGLLERLAGGGVVCLLVDDVEHADPATRDFAAAMLRLSRRVPLAIVLGYHPDELNRRHSAWGFVQSVAGNAAVERITLGPLGRDDLSELIEALGGERPTLSVAAALFEGSRGSPLLASQLLAARQVLEGVRLSDPLDEIIHARLARLDANVVQALRLLALSGQPLAAEKLLAVRLPTGHVERTAIGRALDSGLARPAGGQLVLAHDLVGEAIASLILPAERQSLHSALADLADEPAVAAWHWDEARQPEAAQRAYVLAAAAAERLDPGATPLAHYQRALELGEGDPKTLAAAARAADAAGAFRRAVTLTEQAIDRQAGGRLARLRAAGGDDDERTAVGVLFEQLGRQQRAAGDAASARAAFESAEELLPAAPSTARARALAALAQDLMLEGRFEHSQQLAEQARSTAAAIGAAALAEQGHATCTLGVDVAYLGQLERGLRLLEEATELSRRAGRLDDVVRAYANRTTLLDLDSRRERRWPWSARESPRPAPTALA